MYGQDENCATATGCGTIYYGTIYCGTFYYGTFYFGAFQFQPVGMLQQSSSDGLCETLYFEEGVPLLRAALTTYDNGVTGDLRLIEKFLHQEPVLDVIVGKFIDAEQVKVTVILDTSLQFLGILGFQP